MNKAKQITSNTVALQKNYIKKITSNTVALKPGVRGGTQESRQIFFLQKKKEFNYLLV